MCTPLPAQDHSGVYAPMDVQNGEQLFRANCARCHGTTGDAVPGVNLMAGIHRASTDEELAKLITTGIPGTAMPATQFSQSELRMLVAYLRSMRDFHASTVNSGDATRGRALFVGRGDCTSCHRVQGVGSRVGPDLSDIGATRSAAAIWSSLVDPSSSMRPINRSVRVVTSQGDTIIGRRLNEDTHSVQIIDEYENLRSLLKSDMREFHIMKTSPMPSYRDRLTEHEIADLVGYLVTLKGDQ